MYSELINSTLPVQIPHPTKAKVKFPTFFNDFRVKFPSLLAQVMVKLPGFTRGKGMLKSRIDLRIILM